MGTAFNVKRMCTSNREPFACGASPHGYCAVPTGKVKLLQARGVRLVNWIIVARGEDVGEVMGRHDVDEARSNDAAHVGNAPIRDHSGPLSKRWSRMNAGPGFWMTRRAMCPAAFAHDLSGAS